MHRCSERGIRKIKSMLLSSEYKGYLFVSPYVYSSTYADCFPFECTICCPWSKGCQASPLRLHYCAFCLETYLFASFVFLCFDAGLPLHLLSASLVLSRHPLEFFEVVWNHRLLRFELGPLIEFGCARKEKQLLFPILKHGLTGRWNVCVKRMGLGFLSTWQPHWAATPFYFYEDFVWAPLLRRLIGCTFRNQLDTGIASTSFSMDFFSPSPLPSGFDEMRKILKLGR